MVNGFPKETHAIVLSTYLKGTALEVFHRISVELSKDYDVLKAALLNLFQVTVDQRRKQFREVNGDFVLLFDESLNNSMKTKQVNFHIRFWDVNNQVKTRYLTFF